MWHILLLRVVDVMTFQEVAEEAGSTLPTLTSIGCHSCYLVWGPTL